MTTAIQRTNGASNALALAPPGATWTAEDIALIRELTAKNADDAEFKLLLYMAYQYQLDPLLKQIYLVKYGNKPAQIFAGRDGYLAIAQRSGDFDGISTTVRVEPVPFSVEYVAWENNTRRAATFSRDVQYVATCTVWHRRMTHPVISEVWESEYATGQNLWVSKPRTMIAKVAECQALRKAFNISGLYDPDEIRADPPQHAAPTRPAGVKQLGTVDEQTGEIMGEAHEVAADPPRRQPTTPIPTETPPATDPAWTDLAPDAAPGLGATAEQKTRIDELRRALHWTGTGVVGYLRGHYGKETRDELTRDEAEEMIDDLQGRVAADAGVGA